MSEIDEVATAMLPAFLIHLRTNKKLLPHDKRPAAEWWVRSQMNETQEIMDQIAYKLVELISHRWVQGTDVGLTGSLHDRWLCKNCGVLRCVHWPKYPETTCKGKVKITFKGDLS